MIGRSSMESRIASVLPRVWCSCQLQGGTMKQSFSVHSSRLLSTTVTPSPRTTWYHVVRGEGVTVVESSRLEWTEKDCFIVPPWSWHEHQTLGNTDAILLSIDDRPIMQALEFYREERQVP